MKVEEVKKTRTNPLYDILEVLRRTIRLKNKARRQNLQKAVRKRLQDHMEQKWDQDTEELDSRTAFWNLQRVLRKKKTTIPSLDDGRQRKM